jgi:hypothetical protein
MQLRLFGISFVVVFILASAMAIRANTPAPPVNQTIGIDDSVFDNLAEADCRLCHENPGQFPVDPETIPDRHHLLIGQQVSDPTDRPFPDGDTNGNYDCFSCHNLIWDPVTMTSQFETFRDCMFCHQQIAGESTVHHLTARAQGGACAFCHGDIVTTMDGYCTINGGVCINDSDCPDFASGETCGDGHIIPVYEPSLVTPSPSGGDGQPLNSRGNGAGACDYCHDYGTSDEGVLVETNVNTHHGTGFFAQGNCNWCHGPGHGSGSTNCVECHGHDSGTLYDLDASYPYTPGVETSQGRGTYKSHSTHTETDSDDMKGPGIYCDTCHDINNFPYFKSGTDSNGDGNFGLSETDVCDSCHSPGGTYDGIDDAVIGAKNNWR